MVCFYVLLCTAVLILFSNLAEKVCYPGILLVISLPDNAATIFKAVAYGRQPTVRNHSISHRAAHLIDVTGGPIAN